MRQAARCACPRRSRPQAGQQRRIGLTGLELGQPRIHVAAEIHDLNVGPQPFDLGLAAQRGGAEYRPLGQVRQRGVSWADESIAGIGAREDGADGKTRRQHRRHVLHGMHGKVGIARKQSLLDLLGEKTFATYLAQGTVLNAVP